MSLFGNDKEQDARLDAIEYHVRLISDALQQGQLDIASLSVKLISIQAQIESKLSEEDFDPSVIALKGQLEEARIELDKASSAATDSWSVLHAGSTKLLSALRKSVANAASELEEKLRK